MAPEVGVKFVFVIRKVPSDTPKINFLVSHSEIFGLNNKGNNCSRIYHDKKGRAAKACRVAAVHEVF